MATPTPTTETSLLDIKTGTNLQLQVYKPDASRVQIIMVAPDGKYKVLMEWTLLTEALVTQNRKNETLADPPVDQKIYNASEWQAFTQAANESTAKPTLGTK